MGQNRQALREKQERTIGCKVRPGRSDFGADEQGSANKSFSTVQNDAVRNALFYVSSREIPVALGAPQ
jgi:hypothetical protein